MDDRIDRERAFHDHRYADDPRVRLGSVYRAAAAGYRRYRELVLLAGTGADVLEIGCGGTGISGVLGPAARTLTGIDVSEVAVDRARSSTAEAATGWKAEVSFRVMNAEAMEFADGSLDLVCGEGILHHADVDRVAAETVRVLRPGGAAVFLEPMGHNPLLNLFRRTTPRLRSADEHPLLESDLAGLSRHFGEVSVERFALLAPLAAPLMRWRLGTRAASRLEGIDRSLLARFGWARRWAWIVVIQLSEPRV